MYGAVYRIRICTSSLAGSSIPQKIFTVIFVCEHHFFAFIFGAQNNWVTFLIFNNEIGHKFFSSIFFACFSFQFHFFQYICVYTLLVWVCMSEMRLYVSMLNLKTFDWILLSYHEIDTGEFFFWIVTVSTLETRIKKCDIKWNRKKYNVTNTPIYILTDCT